jgi:hypothetical protein
MKYFSIRKTAEMIGFSHTYVEYLVKNGKLKRENVMVKTPLIPMSEIKRWKKEYGPKHPKR